MPVSKETKNLLTSEIRKLKVEEADQDKIVTDLKNKADSSAGYFGQALAKLNTIKNTIKAYEKDMRNDANPNNPV